MSLLRTTILDARSPIVPSSSSSSSAPLPSFGLPEYTTKASVFTGLGVNQIRSIPGTNDVVIAGGTASGEQGAHTEGIKRITTDASIVWTALDGGLSFDWHGNNTMSLSDTFLYSQHSHALVADSEYTTKLDFDGNVIWEVMPYSTDPGFAFASRCAASPSDDSWNYRGEASPGNLFPNKRTRNSAGTLVDTENREFQVTPNAAVAVGTDVIVAHGYDVPRVVGGLRRHAHTDLGTLIWETPWGAFTNPPTSTSAAHCRMELSPDKSVAYYTTGLMVSHGVILVVATADGAILGEWDVNAMTSTATAPGEIVDISVDIYGAVYALIWGDGVLAEGDIVKISPEGIKIWSLVDDLGLSNNATIDVESAGITRLSRALEVAPNGQIYVGSYNPTGAVPRGWITVLTPVL